MIACVVRDGGVILALAGGLAGWVGGLPAALGVVAGGVVGLAHFWWLAAGARSACAAGPAGARRGWLVGSGLRLGGLLLAVAALLASGRLHPVALVAGLTIVPAVLIRYGLGGAGAGERD